MSYGFERLQEIGIKQIHKDTHISIASLEAILNGDTEKINKVQLSGFISILEREYQIDLSNMKPGGPQNVDDLEAISDPEGEELFLDNENNNKKTSFYYIILTIIVLIIMFFFGTHYLLQDEEGYLAQKIESLSKMIDKTTNDNNDSNDSQGQQPKPIQVVVPKEPQEKKEINDTTTQIESSQKSFFAVTQEEDDVKKESIVQQKQNEIALPPKEFTIYPKSRVWLGYIDLDKKIKKQKVLSKPLTLSGEKEWLLFFGHSNVNIEINDVNQSYKGPSRLRIHYEDGQLMKVTAEEFQQLNDGHKW